MAQFLPPKELIKELKTLIVEAEVELFIISPFIKLHDEIKKILLDKKDESDFHLIVLFGKNERDLSKSLSINDFEFFKQFQNVEIRYVENLHAKYYANEKKSIITSLNLHSFSIDNNIEVGVMFEQTRGARLLNLISENLARDSNTDYDAFDYFKEVLDKSIIHFEKKVKIKSSWFGLVKKQDGNTVEVDNSEKIYHKEVVKEEIQKSKIKMGFCIRTGLEIPFNIKEPFSKTAYESWSKWKNKDFKEKYCHFSGEETNGETTFSKPVLRKNFTAAMKIQKELDNR